VICKGDAVDFTDMSYNGVTGWNWTFTGGSPSNSILENPTVTYDTPGTYSVSLTADDGVSNLSTTKTAYITVLDTIGKTIPLVEGFETTTAIPNNDWFLFNPDNSTAWNFTTTAAYTGTKSMKLNSSQIASGNLDEFISSTIDLSSLSAVLVTFKYSFAQKNTSNSDIFKVYVSNDCGESWTIRKQISSDNLATVNPQSSAFTPTTQAQWQESQITNITSSYLVSNFRMKFSFESGGGNNLYIDDINISGTPLAVEDMTYDFGLTAYPNPFETHTNISFNLDNEKDVILSVYDIIGKEVMGVVNGNLSEGKHTYRIDGSDLGSGVYFVKLKAGNRETVKKVVLQ
jgi:PKD repeat protein